MTAVTLLKKYFLGVGVLLHLFILVVFLMAPSLFDKVIFKLKSKYYDSMVNIEQAQFSDYKLSVDEEIEATVVKWQPDDKKYPVKTGIWIGGRQYDNLNSAIKALEDGDELAIGEGRYEAPFMLNKNHITITGYGHVVFENKAHGKKAYIVNRGESLTIRNIECRNIRVSDKNGACIRQEGKHLTLEHVYFHDSENGILERSKNPGTIYVYDSFFEKLGFGGRAHGIYSNTADLYVYDSIFVATKSQGHSIKNRGAKTHIFNTILASLSSVDSRLIDTPNGGQLLVENSVLQQGRKSANGQAIGYGLEGMGRHADNSVRLNRNVFLLERPSLNVLLALEDKNTTSSVVNNIIISGSDMKQYAADNVILPSRQAANYPVYPYFPLEICQLSASCKVKTPL